MIFLKRFVEQAHYSLLSIAKARAIAIQQTAGCVDIANQR